MKKAKLFELMTVAILILSLAACGSGPAPSPSSSDPVEAKVPVNVGMIKGPTGMGAAYLMEQSENSNTANDYKFTLSAAPTDITGLIASGNLDIAAISTNLAANLYQKTNGDVKVIALNTLGVLYILENGGEIQSVSDLAGKTVCAFGQGANPEYVLNYILRKNGLEPGVDVTVEFRDADEIATLMSLGEMEICMLAVPNITSVMMKNTDVRIALDLTGEWDAVGGGSKLTMGCVGVRQAFLDRHPEAVAKFLEEYEASINYANEHINEAAKLMVKHEIIGSAQVAESAIPAANLVFISGDDMRPAIEGYFDALFDADPASIGGAVPGEKFYYKAS